MRQGQKSGSPGDTQTYNGGGPTFGGGFDFRVYPDLSWGEEHPWSYGDGFYWETAGLLPNNRVCGVGPACGYTAFDVGALETYIFSADLSEPPPPPVPEPGSLVLLGTGVAGIVARLRRRAG
jgi:hypothetical protein